MSGGLATMTTTLREFRRRVPLVAQIVRYALVGASSTILAAALFLLLRNWLDAVPANLVSLTVSTAASTEISRRFAFGAVRPHRVRAWIQDVGTIIFYATYNSAALLLLHSILPKATALEETLTVVAASLGGGCIRFLVLRLWVFESH